MFRVDSRKGDGDTPILSLVQPCGSETVAISDTKSKYTTGIYQYESQNYCFKKLMQKWYDFNELIFYNGVKIFFT